MSNQFMLGCCYYPEHWEKSSLRFDLERMKALGFNVIRMGEFSWSMYEREEGEYDFSLLTEAVRIAGELGLNVILGTPTAAPPKWLTDKYPEALCKDANGVVMQHGSRQHHNHTSEVYLRYCEIITERMVKAFCGFKNVIGWQIDNELNCHRNESYAETDDAAFRNWLIKKYGTIQALNSAWGTRFWSLEFNGFSQIRCPGPTPAYKNPSMMTDYYLFLSDTVIHFAARQAKIIKKYMPGAFITHNGYFENVDYKKLTDQCLDILGFDSYPAFNEKSGKGNGRQAAYRLALTRGCSEKFLLLEQQSGPGGQNSYLLPTPLPGQLRLWTYQSIAYGAVSVLYFRYRTALYGAEQLWYGIYDHDGQENYRSREIRKIAEELGRCGDLFLRERQHNQVAFFYDYHNVSANKTESFAADDQWEIYMALNRKNIHADFIYTAEEMDRYKIVIFPHIAIADEALNEKIAAYTSCGGVCILSARSGTKDKNDHYYPLKPPGVFRKTAGCRADWFTAMPEHEEQCIQMGGRTYPITDYYELLETEGGEVIGTYTDGFCRGKAGAVKNGNVYYLGFYAKACQDMYVDIIKNHMHVKEPLDENLEEIVIGTYTMYLNHGGRPVQFSGYDVLTGCEVQSIPPYGVMLLKNPDNE